MDLDLTIWVHQGVTILHLPSRVDLGVLVGSLGVREAHIVVLLVLLVYKWSSYIDYLYWSQ